MRKAFLVFLGLGITIFIFGSIVPVIIIIFLYSVNSKKDVVNELLNKKDSILDISYHESSDYDNDNIGWSDGSECYHDDCGYDSYDCDNDD